MRRIISWNMLSLDGFYERPGEGLERIDWHLVNDEWNRLSVESLENTGTLLFGRATYQMFSGFWPTQDDPVAKLINNVDKAVVSRTLETPGWHRSRILGGDLKTAIEKLKAEPGKPIVVYGSGKLVQALTALGLIDEYMLAYAPVALGTGTPLFEPGAPRLSLNLTGTKRLDNGVMMLTYSRL
jgi:dihydrofolate reductase